jgi:hypothetical protein
MRTRQALFAVLIATSLVSTTGCKLRRSSDRAATTKTTSAETSATSGRARLSELEGHATYGRAWGNDATGQRLADSLRQTLVDDEGFGASEIGVAVQRVTTSSPERIVAVVKAKYLKDERRADREDLAEVIHGTLVSSAPPDAEIVFGMRGAVLYGVVGRAEPGARLDVGTGASVSTEKLERALSTDGATL